MSTNSSFKQPFNRTVLLVCSGKKIGELKMRLEEMGCSVLPLPVIEAHEIQDKSLLDKAISSLQQYTWIIFTSGYGVTYFTQRLRELVPGDPSGNMPKICAIGPATAKVLTEGGFSTTLIPEQFVAEGVIQSLERYHGGLEHLAGCSILLPRAEDARDVLPDTLRAAGAHVDVVPCYRTVRATIDEHIIRQIRSRSPDLIVFTSSSTVRNLVGILGRKEGERILRESAVAVIGPITANTVASFGKHVDIIPVENTTAALIESIREYCSQ